jgi:disulfide bond formation protein DsbB
VATTTFNLHAAATAAIGAEHRSDRVRWLLGAIVVLSLVDLLVTLSHMTGSGMFEANPLVQLIAKATGSAAAIGAFKGLSVLVGVLLLDRTRRHLQAELAAWLMVIVLACVTIQWVQYAAAMPDLDAAQMADYASHNADWVRLS